MALWPRPLLTSPGGFGPVRFDGSSAVTEHPPSALCLENGTSRLGPLQLLSCRLFLALSFFGYQLSPRY